MRVAHDDRGIPVPSYDPGDFVRFRQDEVGPVVTAFAGEWGKVVKVGDGSIDVLLAGHSRPRTAPLPVAAGVPARCVDPCDFRGVLIVLRPVPPLRSRTPAALPRRRRSLGTWLTLGAFCLVAAVLAGVWLPRG